jgi:hypothetical protein
MLVPGEVVSYLDMCREEGVNLQRGMNYRVHGDASVFLMSVRPGAPYADRVENEGRVLIYEGHDQPATRGGQDPKSVDQPMKTPSGGLTENGKFFEAARRHRVEGEPPILVRVYEKMRSGIWVYNGPFRLIDAWEEASNGRKVFKFRLEIAADAIQAKAAPGRDLEQNRLIPTAVKLAVWKRDAGRCIQCGSTDNLHFDHVIPYSLGGSSLVAENIQLLCARHNLAKHDRIE